MTKDEAFSLLNLQPNATPDDIRKAWRRLAIQYHPDKNPGNKNAEAKFKQINEAHQFLTEPSKTNSTNWQNAQADFIRDIRDMMIKLAIAEIKRGSVRAIWAFIQILENDFKNNVDAETQKKIEQLKQLYQTIHKMKVYVCRIYLGNMIAMLCMIAYNLIFGYEKTGAGTVVYPAMMVTVFIAALGQDKIQKQVLNTSKLAEEIAQKVR